MEGEINESNRIQFWRFYLVSDRPEPVEFAEEYDLPNQRTIERDILRTRSDTLDETERSELEKLLTSFCKNEHIRYKQGLNELFAPFLLLKRKGLDLTDVYLYAKGFIANYMPTTFVDSEFLGLQAQFYMLRLLIKYHDPRLSDFLTAIPINPELYATPWFLTFFSSKLSLDLLYTFWDNYMIINEKYFILFFCLAFLLQHKQEVTAKQEEEVPLLLNTIAISDQETLAHILTKAKELMAATPFSSLIYFDRLQVFNPLYYRNSLETLEKMPCLQILPKEMISKAYPEVRLCQCGERECRWCTRTTDSVRYVILDIRPSGQQHAGTIPITHLIHPDSYDNLDVMAETPDQFANIRGDFHIGLLGAREFKNSSFDLMTYDETECDVTQNMIENLLIDFYNKGFQYVSVISGGFEKCHKLAVKHGLEIQNHSPPHCLVCTPEGYSRFNITRKLKKFAGKIMGGNKKQPEEKITIESSELKSIKRVNKASAVITKQQIDRWNYDITINVFHCQILRTDEKVVLVVDRQEVTLIDEYQVFDYQPESLPVSHVIKKFSIEDLSKIAAKPKVLTSLILYFDKDQKIPILLETENDKKLIISLLTEYHNSKEA